MINKDFIIVLWLTEGMVTAGSWYDNFFPKMENTELVILTNFVNSETKKLHYMDFGRYHTPEGYGRVRDAETDPDVGIPFFEIKNNKILNIDKILKDASSLKI